jgi:BirA family biotin operon repressor/biotin-[acetyl-CoA-carboxylase] ligase
VCLSLGWSFVDMPRDLSALTLAIGVCAQRALGVMGARGVMLKWPNDLVTVDAKVGGILLELRAEASGPAYVVIGIGINVSLPEASRAAIVAAGGVPVDIRSLTESPVRRNALVAQLINECVSGLQTFRATGFAAFHREWNSLDALRGREVTLLQSGENVRGVARGVDSHGQLLLEVAGQVTAHASGEVSVRLAEPESHRFD